MCECECERERERGRQRVCVCVCVWSLLVWCVCVFVATAGPMGPMDGTGRGSLPPGPISNDLLLKQNGDPIQNLRPGRVGHYRGINVKVWSVFLGIYGGGPLLRRKTLDIYDTTPC